MENKKYLINILILTLGTLAIMAAVNLWADPSHLLNTDTVPYKISKLLELYPSVKVNSNYNERVAQKYRIEKLKISPDVILLGSSRALPINTLQLNCGSLRNYSVSGATLKDDIALLWMVLHKNIKPKEVIISADPWLLNATNMNGGWESLDDEYHKGSQLFSVNKKARQNLSTLWLDKLLTFISYTYFEASVRSVINTLRYPSEKGDVRPGVCSPLEDNCQTLFKDGSRRSNSKSDIQQAESAALQYTKNIPIYGNMDSFINLDPILADSLVSMVKYLHNHGIKVVLLLLPYHPITYKNMLDRPEIQLSQAESYIKEKFRSQAGVKVVGSYDPKSLGLTKRDFHDGMHLTETAIKRILDQYHHDICLLD